MKDQHTSPFLKRWILRLYIVNDSKLLHPISVHLPNGMVPVAGLFMLLGCLFQVQVLVQAATLNLAVIFFAMPAVIFTGFASWQHRYKGSKTPLFRTKIFCSAVVFLLSGLILLVQALHPVQVENLDARDWGLAGAYLTLLIPTILAGSLGGRLVFGGRKKMPPAAR